jgi:hypothetical protein
MDNLTGGLVVRLYYRTGTVRIRNCEDTVTPVKQDELLEAVQNWIVQEYTARFVKPRTSDLSYLNDHVAAEKLIRKLATGHEDLCEAAESILPWAGAGPSPREAARSVSGLKAALSDRVPAVQAPAKGQGKGKGSTLVLPPSPAGLGQGKGKGKGAVVAPKRVTVIVRRPT